MCFSAGSQVQQSTKKKKSKNTLGGSPNLKPYGVLRPDESCPDKASLRTAGSVFRFRFRWYSAAPGYPHFRDNNGCRGCFPCSLLAIYFHGERAGFRHQDIRGSTHDFVASALEIAASVVSHDSFVLGIVVYEWGQLIISSVVLVKEILRCKS